MVFLDRKKWLDLDGLSLITFLFNRIRVSKGSGSGKGQISMRFRSAELLKEVRFFFGKMHENETHYVQTVVFMHLKKNTAI